MSRQRIQQTSGLSRRTLLSTAGATVLGASGAGSAVAAGSAVGRFGQPHLRPHAKNIVWLFMSGGPSQVDSFDPKPALTKLHRQDVPESIAKTLPRLKEASLFNLMASPYRFRQHGESGLPVSDLFPETAKHIDRLCVIRSMQHGTPVHGPGECVALTGTALGDRPSLGAWVSLGVGTQNRSLPGFIVMNLLTSGMQYPQLAGWGPGFLPAEHQGVVVDPVRGISDLKLPAGTSNEMRKRQLGLLDFLNRRHIQALGQHSELEARIRSYGTAFRMQTHAPELLALDQETETTQRRYGMLDDPTKATGRSLLLTRRMVERGVRFIQVRIGGWDAHGNLKGNHDGMAAKTDRPVAAFLEDLEQRGLLDETLVVWGGEFGRTPTMEGLGNGRNHNPLGYTVWLAGGGIKGGQAIGATDELGYAAVEDPVSISDFHATLIHALGIDQHQLIWPHHGRNEIPTNLGGRVVKAAFA